MIKDINPNYSSIYNDYDYKPSFTKAGNNIYFRATDGTNGFEIFILKEELNRIDV